MNGGRWTAIRVLAALAVLFAVGLMVRALSGCGGAPGSGQSEMQRSTP